MPPQASELLPGPVAHVIVEMQGHWARDDRDGTGRGCERVAAILQGMEGASQDPTVRRKVARGYFDLGLWYRDLGRTAEAEQALGRSRDRWAGILAADPGDWYARAQQAACHNHLGLIAHAAGDWEEAESEYDLAFEARYAVYKVVPLGDDFADNLAYLGGVSCNQGNLAADRGDFERAARVYDAAIYFLSEVLPKPHGHETPEDEEVLGFFLAQWEQDHGIPHPFRVARQFLANARAGREALVRGPQA